ncbi:hypothetical protein MRS44_000857 [Fusarium solani]|uniref:uncharacterized protein n=1 Tax=Fusarium solani TaxID=169388 RepID=UPI0032C48F74|nr:hypothetical protein MRS44_000857 [Fusarium solani]
MAGWPASTASLFLLACRITGVSVLSTEKQICPGSCVALRLAQWLFAASKPGSHELQPLHPPPATCGPRLEPHFFPFDDGDDDLLLSKAEIVISSRRTILFTNTRTCGVETSATVPLLSTPAVCPLHSASSPQLSPHHIATSASCNFVCLRLTLFIPYPRSLLFDPTPRPVPLARPVASRLDHRSRTSTPKPTISSPLARGQIAATTQSATRISSERIIETAMPSQVY